MEETDEKLESQSFESATYRRFGAVPPTAATRAASDQNLASRFTRIVTHFGAEFDARDVCLYLLCSDGKTLALSATSSGDGLAPAHLDLKTGVHPVARATREHLLQVSNNDERGDEGKRETTCALPLFVGSQAIGAVCATFQGLTEKDCEALRGLGEALWELIEREQHREESERTRIAMRDRMTRTELVVHDLRQPLTVMLTIGSALSRTATDEGKRALWRLGVSGALLDRMIEDLKDTSFLETGRVALTPAPTNLADLVREVIARHATDAQIGSIAELPCIDLDPQRIEQVLMNILANARKYGNADVPTQIEIERDDKVAIVSVTNGGTGIREEDREKIFEAYYRGAGHDAPGLGLGLYICRNIIQQHGGRIWVDSAATRTRFCFSLPIVRASGAERVTCARAS
jgi:signal transduction histidine kinase